MRGSCALLVLFVVSLYGVNGLEFESASLVEPYKFAPLARVQVQLVSTGTSFRIENTLDTSVDLRLENKTFVFADVGANEITDYCEDCAVDTPLSIYFHERGNEEPFANCTVPPRPVGQFMTVRLLRQGSEYVCSDITERDTMQYSVEFVTKSGASARSEYVSHRFNLSFVVTVPIELAHMATVPNSQFTAIVGQSNDTIGRNYRRVPGPPTYFDLDPYFIGFNNIPNAGEGSPLQFALKGVFDVDRSYSCFLVNQNSTEYFPNFRTRNFKPENSQQLTITIDLSEFPILSEDCFLELSEVTEHNSKNETTIANSMFGQVLVLFPKSVEDKLTGGELALIIIGTVTLAGLVLGLAIWYRRRVVAASNYSRVPPLPKPGKTKYGSADVFSSDTAMGI